MIHDETWPGNNKNLVAVHYIPGSTLSVGGAAGGLHGVCVLLL